MKSALLAGTTFLGVFMMAKVCCASALAPSTLSTMAARFALASAFRARSPAGQQNITPRRPLDVALGFIAQP